MGTRRCTSYTMAKNLELKAQRVRKNLTQSDVAKILGITTFTYQRKENGVRSFTVEEAKKLSDTFGKSIEEIFFNLEVTKREYLKEG